VHKADHNSCTTEFKCIRSSK